MTGAVESRPLGNSPLRRATRYLEDNHVPYKIFDHDPRFSAAAEALACGVAPCQAAKTVVLRDDEGGHLLAVIPASERLDLDKARRLLPSEPGLRLATEDELADEFGDFELGAVPPFGSMVSIPEVIDERLLEGRRILCNGGDHRHSLLVDPVELASLAGARIGDLCQV